MAIDEEKLERKEIVWTETSKNSMLNTIKELIEQYIGVEGVSNLKEIIENQEYKKLQTILGLKGKNVDGKLGKLTLEKLYEYIQRQDTKGEFLNVLDSSKADLKVIKWTETSKNSTLPEIKEFLESKLSNSHIQELYDLILKKDYKGFQKKLGMVGKGCDGMLGRETLKALYEQDFSEDAKEEENSKLDASETNMNDKLETENIREEKEALIKKDTSMEEDIQEEDIQYTEMQETEIQKTEIQETEIQETEIQETEVQETETPVVESVKEKSNKKGLWSRLFTYDSTPVGEKQFEYDMEGNVIGEGYYDKKGKKTGVRKVFKTEYNVTYTYEITYKKGRSDGLSRQFGPNGELLQEGTLKDGVKVGERKCFDGGYPRIVTYNDEGEEIAIREME